MPEVDVRRHPLFDPSSHYSRLRACVRAEGKMCGYLHWLAARAKRIGGLSPTAPRLEPERRALADTLVRSGVGGSGQGPGIEVLDVLDVRALVVSWDLSGDGEPATRATDTTAKLLLV